MKPILRKRHLVWLLFFSLPLLLPSSQAIAGEERRNLEQEIPAVAERFIGVPCSFGKGHAESGAVDNSHLFALIYHEAATRAGLEFRGYMPMEELLGNTIRVERDDLRNGDLIVLENGHAALIYKVESAEMFHMMYASLKREQVISFNSQNVAFDAYWLPNLKGFFRLTDLMFHPHR
ncbi:MAG: peptidoglycan endopeptidase [Deltaproteobacteria bacterium]|nr:peptidoglycan endopeptidase [Deltaproteobacteria bacterium]